MTAKSRYAARGVSSGKEEVHKAVVHLDKGLFPGAFCRIFPDLAGDPKYGSIQHVDGAGTKPSLAYLAYLERFGIKVWAGITQDALVMNLDDVACVGATGRMHVSQIIDRNKFLIRAAVVEEMIASCKTFCDSMREYAFELVYVSGETADLPDLTRTVSVNNVVSTRIKRTDVIDASNMVPGDLIIGLSSTGQARWEKRPNAGGGANGLTNMRHDSLSPYYRQFTETYAPQVPKSLVYRGKYRLRDPLPGDGSFTIGSALLSPTRTYLPFIGNLLTRVSRKDIHGIIHCSGGGQTKIRNFGGPGNVYVKDNPFPIPPLFAMLKEAGGISWREMYSTCNNGHRLEVIIPAKAEEACFEAAEWSGIEARRVGFVKRNSSKKNQVIIEGPFGTLIY